MPTKDDLLARLRPLGQAHLVDFWDELTNEQRSRLAEEIAAVDFEAVRGFLRGKDDAPDWPTLARQAKPPKAIRLQASSSGNSRDEARRRGEEALRRGQVAMILVAGGQGTRLGFPQPKGMFPIGPVSQRTLFQVLVDRLRAVSRRFGCVIPLYVMTSRATHDDTVAYFAAHQQLGLNAADLRFFCQSMLPAVDRHTGRILLASKSELALSPDGHGGMLAALLASGCLEDARRRGIEHFFYGQVDNPLLQVCDPEFVGYHLLSGSEMTTQVVPKRYPLERVGNVVEIAGVTRIIEYSDLPDDVAEKRAADGGLYLWAGNLAVHMFPRQFLERVVGNSQALPIHRAYKRVSFVDAEGEFVAPAGLNAVKFERFIFDLLPVAERAVVVEVDPAQAFSPVKNSSGERVDTPETARAAMVESDTRLLRSAGFVVPEQVPVEVNPLWALDAGEASQKFVLGTRITGRTYFV